MIIIRTIPELKEAIGKVRSMGRTIGFVPTMGYLHQGHLSLVKAAVKECDFVAVSIYVNPIQFGVGEDFESYPRDLTADAQMCQQEGVDLIFSPGDQDMYPGGYASFVEVEQLTQGLCGRGRPGHFRGVTTVVTKLFNLLEPDIAYFGQKDAQQALVLKKMVEDLNMNLTLKIMPTLRDEDGLAMSSRNVYLSLEEREAALVLFKSLTRAEEMIQGGVRKASKISGAMKEIIAGEPSAHLEYIEIVDTHKLDTMEELEAEVLIALAVRVGQTRLIDNMIVEV
ncbi:pantoate--beta-alanine ligase [Candidatus Contubernalis alkaliaceticus]|uniref:pantoate--beta-alanine ligase n=1 Tax=Candidatus Contubernalis alkaliaceticus TaxID=338645 RepID=UPI001F4BCEA5|nr:pantoate--beta-alanine ligase [Candidatus Contubernalis alkalaceticus]UNC91814.1 pantoate--beta-alanine ligase [Candidatus Contubernalis alkalaceticus]